MSIFLYFFKKNVVNVNEKCNKMPNITIFIINLVKNVALVLIVAE